MTCRSAQVNDMKEKHCRDERLRLGMDEVVSRIFGHTLCYCRKPFSAHNIHAGKFILWNRDAKLAAIGSAIWCRKKLLELLRADPPKERK